MAAPEPALDRDDAGSEGELPAKFGRMVGQSAPMRELFALLQRAASKDGTVLIEGETGTGKEVTAIAIHEHSYRRAGPFVVVDCGAIPSQLLESELFGYERGAFTGAVASREGAFEAAQGGTIFMDEIGELSLDLQPKILRALEGHKVKRIGSRTYHDVDVRVIAATNRSLREEVAARRFRSDLYYRLAVLNVRLPPLRDRKEDVPALVDDVLKQLGVRDSAQAAPLRTKQFIDMLTRYRWPGNVRQLRNYVERRVALGDAVSAPGTDSVPPPPPEGAEGKGAQFPGGPNAKSKDDEPAVSLDQPLKAAREEWIAKFEARYLRAMLTKHDNNVAAAARAAGVDRAHFYRLLWKHGLRAQESSSESE